MTEDYDGHVDPGGPAIARRVTLGGGATVEVRKLSVGPMDNNVYLLTDETSGRALLIDAANDAERILAELGAGGSQGGSRPPSPAGGSQGGSRPPSPRTDLAGIVTTHGHHDHWQALVAVAEATGAPVYLHPADADLVPRRADHEATDGMRVAFGSAEVTLIHTPGHTPGSTCVLLDDRHLFTGDTLFPGGPGNTFGDPEAFTQIMRSLRERVFALPDDTWVYPGHGDDTTIGAERGALDEWERRGW